MFISSSLSREVVVVVVVVVWRCVNNGSGGGDRTQRWASEALRDKGSNASTRGKVLALACGRSSMTAPFLIDASRLGGSHITATSVAIITKKPARIITLATATQ